MNFGFLFVAMAPILFSDNLRGSVKLLGEVAVLTIGRLMLMQGL